MDAKMLSYGFEPKFIRIWLIFGFCVQIKFVELDNFRLRPNIMTSKHIRYSKIIDYVTNFHETVKIIFEIGVCTTGVPRIARMKTYHVQA